MTKLDYLPKYMQWIRLYYSAMFEWDKNLNAEAFAKLGQRTLNVLFLWPRISMTWVLIIQTLGLLFNGISGYHLIRLFNKWVELEGKVEHRLLYYSHLNRLRSKIQRKLKNEVRIPAQPWPLQPLQTLNY